MSDQVPEILFRELSGSSQIVDSLQQEAPLPIYHTLGTSSYRGSKKRGGHDQYDK
ncbi:hypothetical protein GMLC_31010 [Geomonas limicola]|uniref:Uncharacterized protein n=1 Tax=Geomonas limicola TaxID=2740186 RepID=A0A6V8NA97_9BACT|nr:hypothetical protein GMLC_31010 [Geomonas limicola]